MHGDACFFHHYPHRPLIRCFWSSNALIRLLYCLFLLPYLFCVREREHFHLQQNQWLKSMTSEKKLHHRRLWCCAHRCIFLSTWSNLSFGQCAFIPFCSSSSHRSVVYTARQLFYYIIFFCLQACVCMCIYIFDTMLQTSAIYGINVWMCPRRWSFKSIHQWKDMLLPIVAWWSFAAACLIFSLIFFFKFVCVWSSYRPTDQQRASELQYARTSCTFQKMHSYADKKKKNNAEDNDEIKATKCITNGKEKNPKKGTCESK